MINCSSCQYGNAMQLSSSPDVSEAISLESLMRKMAQPPEEKCLKPAFGEVKVWSWEPDSGIRPCPVLLGRQSAFGIADHSCPVLRLPFLGLIECVGILRPSEVHASSTCRHALSTLAARDVLPCTPATRYCRHCVLATQKEGLERFRQ